VPVRRPAAIRLGRLSILVAAAALVASACVPTSDQASASSSPTPTVGPTATPAANPYAGAAAGSGAGTRIGYISYGDVVPYVKDVSDSVRAQAKAAGAELVECDVAMDATKVPDCLKQMADAGVKGLIQFQPVLADPSQSCAGLPANLPVIAIEEPTACAKVLVHADDLRAGQIAGAAVGAWVKSTWSCSDDAYLALQSTTAVERATLRLAGFHQGYASQCAIRNEQLAPRADTAEGATSAVADLLATLSGKKQILVVAMNDEGAQGALDAATAAGRSADVFVVGQGGSSAARAQIRANAQWLGDSAYFPEQYGATAVPALLDLVAGKSVAAELLIEPAWLDKSTIGRYYPN
jgi:ribose transport system substrate-binding protein